MLFLIDENLPTSVGQVFKNKGFRVEEVGKLKELRGKSDEVILIMLRQEKRL